jgi:arabinose-5-phosphate isomerase
MDATEPEPLVRTHSLLERKGGSDLQFCGTPFGDLRPGMRYSDVEQWVLLTAEALMTTDLMTVRAEMLSVKAIQKMEHNRRKPISVMPVMHANGEFKGLLLMYDLVQAGLT